MIAGVEVIGALLLAGGLGAVARFALDGVVRGRVQTRLPLGTMLINVLGSGLLGLLAGLVAGRELPQAVQLIFGTGFLGGFTTLSTASFETVRLLQTGRVRLGIVNVLATLGLSLALAAGGYLLGVSAG